MNSTATGHRKAITLTKLLCAALALTASSLWALQLDLSRFTKPSSKTYSTSYLKSKELLARITQTLTPTADGFLHEEKGDNGQPGQSRTSWIAQEAWRSRPELAPISYHYESNGAENQIIDIKFKASSLEVEHLFVDKDHNKRNARTIRVPAGTMLTGATFYFLSSFPFEQGPAAKISFPVMMPEGDLFSVVITVEKEETITVPAGTFACYKLKFAPKMSGFASLANSLIPDMYIWMQKAEPHHWIQFEGKEEGFTKPRTVSSLISMTAN